MTRTARALALLASAALVLATPVAAQAGKPVEKTVHYADTDSFDEGLLRHRGALRGRVQRCHQDPPRQGLGRPGLLRLRQLRVQRGHLDRGRLIRTHGNGSFHEQKATHIRRHLGVPVHRRGDVPGLRLGGNLLLRATGVFKASEQFDTSVTRSPAAVPEPYTFEVLADNGQTFTDDEFCAAVLPELT